MIVDGSPSRLGTATAALGLPLAWVTSLVPQPFWAKTVAVSFAICRSLGKVNLVSDPVVLCVLCPVAGTVPGPLAVVSSGPRASMPRVLVTTTSLPVLPRTVMSSGNSRSGAGRGS